MSLVKAAQDRHNLQKQRQELYREINNRFMRLYRDNIRYLRGDEKESLDIFLKSRLPTEAIYFIRCDSVSQQQFEHLMSISEIIELDIKSERFNRTLYWFLGTALSAIGLLSVYVVGVK